MGCGRGRQHPGRCTRAFCRFCRVHQPHPHTYFLLGLRREANSAMIFVFMKVETINDLAMTNFLMDTPIHLGICHLYINHLKSKYTSNYDIRSNSLFV